MCTSPAGTTSLFLPPYQSFVSPGDVDYSTNRGVAAVWHVRDAVAQYAERTWLAERPSGVELIVVLPPAAAIHAALPLLRDLKELRPRGILPNGPLTAPEPARLLLSATPRDLAGVVVAYLTRANITRHQRIRGLIATIFELAPTVSSVSKLARKLYTSRRTLGRFFEAEGLPVPSHWLQFARLLHVAVMIQDRQEMPIFRAATQVGYPDGFTMSNQMKRLIGCRPTDVRENLGWEWILEEWLRREYDGGRLRVESEWTWQMNLQQWLRRNPMRKVQD